MNRVAPVRLVALLAAVIVAAAACVPPTNPTAPPEWLPFNTCIRPIDADGIGLIYRGPVDTLFNAIAYVEAGPGASCEGASLPLGNVVRADTELAAFEKCQSILEPTYTVHGARRLRADYDNVPNDAWICQWGAGRAPI